MLRHCDLNDLSQMVVERPSNGNLIVVVTTALISVTMDQLNVTIVARNRRSTIGSIIRIPDSEYGISLINGISGSVSFDSVVEF